MSTQVPSKLAAIIRRLSQEVAAEASPSRTREAARRTGAVPVHSDMGGILLVAPNGSVLHYHPDSGDVSTATEERWRILALVKAARKFPELEPLRPRRPASAEVCTQCGGEGVVLGHVDCAVCWGSGWIVG